MLLLVFTLFGSLVISKNAVSDEKEITDIKFDKPYAYLI